MLFADLDPPGRPLLGRLSVVRRTAALGQPLGAQLDLGARVATVVNASALGMTWWAEPATVLSWNTMAVHGATTAPLSSLA